jgi:hypothetical protein
MSKGGVSAHMVRGPGLALFFLTLTVLVMGLTATAASAKITTWTGLSNQAWSNPGNWDNGVPVDGDDLVFPTLIGSSRYSVNNDLYGAGGAPDPLRVNSITIDTTSTDTNYYILGGNEAIVEGGIYDIGGGAMDIISLLLQFETTQTIEVTQTGHQLNIMGSGIYGDGGIEKTGDGILIYNSACHYLGDTVVSGGLLQVAAVNAVPYGAGAGSVTVNSGATLELLANAAANGLFGDGTVQAASTQKFLTIGSDGSSSSFSGPIIDGYLGSLGLTKTGAGIFTYSGTATYTQVTTVNGGEMCVTGSVANSSMFRMSGAATLSGTGTVGPVTLPYSGSASISPGAAMGAVGTLSTGAETWKSGGTFTVDFTNTTGGNDLAVSGSLTQNTTTSNFVIKPVVATDTMYDFDPAASYHWLIARATSVSGFNASKYTVNTTSFLPKQRPTGTFSVSNVGGNVYLDYTGSGTAVVVKSFGARVRHGHVWLVWKTASQTDTAGFFLERRNARPGKWERVNRAMLPVVNGAGGATYKLTDPKARIGHHNVYRLIEVRMGRGPTATYGPYKVVPRRR